jgi:pSer/pThr/pTyr-binding forkhead associated (FHA) protein
MVKLVVKAQLTEGGTKDYGYEFEQPVINIGRLKENDIQLPVSTVSGYHAQILKEGENYYLLDKGSINGTYLNGERLVSGEKKLLNDGDIIKIQSFELFYSTGLSVMNIDSGATVQVARQMVMEVLGSWQTSTTEKPRIIVMGGPDNGKQLELSDGTVLIAGRTAGCDIVIEHQSVSRKHAEVSLSWNGAHIKDLNSANGTFINDQRLSGTQRLRDRDEIRLGQQTATAPIILVFSNPAEALLSKIENMQVTDSTPGAISAKEMAEAVAKEGEPPAEAEAGEAAEAEAPAGEEAEPAAIEGEEAVYMDEALEEAPAQQKALRKIFSSPLGIIGVIVLLLSAVGLAIFFINGGGTAIVPSVSPPQGATGDVISLKGDFDSADVRSATILQKEALLLQRGQNSVDVKLPDFPELDVMETKTDLVLKGDQGVLARFPFTVLIAPRIQSINPHSGSVGTEVRVTTNMPGLPTNVLFGSKLAGMKSAGQDLIAIVPDPGEAIPERGLRVPITVKINEKQAKNTIDFIIFPITAKPEETFQLSFVAQPYSTSLGFNEYAIETNLGPLLIVVSKDQFGSSRERAEAAARNLNNSAEYFKKNPSAKVTAVKEGDSYALYAEGSVTGERQLLLRAFSEDALGYGKINRRAVSLQELAEWWEMLIGTYYRVFVQIQDPEDTGIISAGGAAFQRVVNFYAAGNEKGERFYRKDFLSTIPTDQKSQLLSLSLNLPAKVARVDGRWIGAMDNKLYSNITEQTLELILVLRQSGDSLSGTAEVTWKIVMSGGGGAFQNYGYKKLGTFNVNGTYRRTKSFPVEFSFVEKDGRRLDFVGKLDGEALKGTYEIRSTGQQGNWTLFLSK